MRKFVCISLMIAVLATSAFFLVACNEQQEDEGDITRDLYVYAIAVSYTHLTLPTKA